MVQDVFETGMYIIDENFTILNVNDTMHQLYPAVKVGDTCYKSIAMQECQCEICPLRQDDALFYNPIRKEWINANAATIDYPGCGNCYAVQFHIRHNISAAPQETLREDNMDEYILELSGGNLDVCAIGSYVEPGAPLSYANEQMIRLMGYDSLEEMSEAVDGMVFNTIHPDDVDHVIVDLTECGLHGGTFESTYRLRRKGNSWLWIVARGKRVQMASGEFVLFCIITEMTEYLKRQEALQEENRELLRKEFASQALLEHMPGGYHQCANAEGWPFLHISKSFEEITGWTKEEIRQEFDNRFINMVLPEDIPLCADIVSEISKNNGYSNAIYRLKRKNGGYTWISDATKAVDMGDHIFYHGTIADVTEHINELEQARLEAEASNQAKSAFLFNASHDIRTPMNAIQGFAHIIEDNAENPAVVLEAVQKLKRSGDILLTLLNEVLELSRIEQGKDAVNLRPLNMQDHAEKLYEMMVQEMAESGISFQMENKIHHPLVMADDLKLSRIAMNYLSNARKFTPAGGTVRFGIEESEYDGKMAVYTLFVEDSGIGMSREFQAHAFEQFEREQTSTASGVTGSGLGLSITRKLADLLDAACGIESELGKGTRMTCSVPMMLAKASDFEPGTVPACADFTGKRILLVEDNNFNREIGRYVLEDMGFLVEEAINGVECLERLTSAPEGYFDLVLMDIQMPIMDGYKATAEIRRYENPSVSGIPIIAMTANAFEEDKKRCLAAGMDGHVAKPMDARRILEELAFVMEKRGGKR